MPQERPEVIVCAAIRFMYNEINNSRLKWRFFIGG